VLGDIGNLWLYAAVASGVLTIVAGAWGGVTRGPRMVRVSELATYASAAFVTAAVITLQIALVGLDFRLAYVGEYTSTTLSIPYRIGSMWAGMGGSLLLWGWIASLCSAWMVLANRLKGLELSSHAYAVAAFFGGLFVFMSGILNSPFAPAKIAIADGAGLNPLLQDPLQLIHPLFLYGGYVLFLLPFYMVCGQLFAGRVDGIRWIAFARKWSILPWISLTIGILLGARWAYAELGWGGYWAWDPVENASLIPWLTATASLHLGLAHRGNRDRLRMRSVIMLMVTFVLCLFGTFLTRSGVIQSVHAFGISNLGPLLSAVIVLCVVGSGAILIWRLPALQYRDVASRSAGWLGQSMLTVLLSAMTFAVLWGTVYPLFARTFRGQEIAVTPGFFRAVVAPLGVGLLLIFAASPFLKGQRVTNVRREAAIRGLIFIVVFGAVFAAQDHAHAGVAAVLALAALAVRTVMVAASRPLGGALRTEANRVRNVAHALSAYFAHLGLIILFSAVALNVTGEIKEQAKIDVGQTVTVSGFDLRLDSVAVQTYADRSTFEAFFSLLDGDGQAVSHIVSSLERFNNSEQLQAQVGITSGVLRDVYVVLDGASARSGAQWVRVTVYDNPFINWIWFGGGMIALGGVLYLLPDARRRRKVSRTMRGAPGQLQLSVGDEDFKELVDTAILTLRAGLTHTANQGVNDILAVARQNAGGTNAEPDAVLAFLHEARGGAVGPAPGAPRNRRPQLWIGLTTVLVLVLLACAYAVVRVNEVDAEAAATTAQQSTSRQVQIERYMAQLAADPANATTLWNLGNSYFSQQQYEIALVYYEKLVAVTPTDANAWIAAGAAAFAGGKSAVAHTFWNRAVVVDPKNVEAHYNLGFWYVSQSPPRESEARAEWAQVLESAPDSKYADAVHQYLAGLDGASPAGSK
jgi:cytochrome c-type biogenesis protein CcmF